MTTAEKLAEIKREFARVGHEVEVSFTRPIYRPGDKCGRCGRRGYIFVRVSINLPMPKKPTSKSAKAANEWLKKMNEWQEKISTQGEPVYSSLVCTDRPRCRLRKAKRDYRKARLREKEQRRRERALRV